jgi:hypothetical protein
MKKLTLALAVIFTIVLSAFSNVNGSKAILPADEATLNKTDFIAQSPMSAPKANLSQADMN